MPRPVIATPRISHPFADSMNAARVEMDSKCCFAEPSLAKTTLNLNSIAERSSRAESESRPRRLSGAKSGSEESMSSGFTPFKRSVSTRSVLSWSGRACWVSGLAFIELAQTTIDRKALAGDVARSVLAKHVDHARDLVGRGCPSQGRPTDQRLEARVGPRSGPLGPDRPCADGVHRDSQRPDLAGQCARQAYDTAPPGRNGGLT